MGCPLIEIDTLLTSLISLSLPIAESILPQLASLPNMAVFTRGDSATVKATDFACFSFLAPETFT
tara:strand:+ start:535 stop:729 length:195 start_codon:yes stop_codon:yes gene_type:complete